jgi:hypothetical protein
VLDEGQIAQVVLLEFTATDAEARAIIGRWAGSA